jgi:hypothetical protein
MNCFCKAFRAWNKNHAISQSTKGATSLILFILESKIKYHARIISEKKGAFPDEYRSFLKEYNVDSTFLSIKDSLIIINPSIFSMILI